MAVYQEPTRPNMGMVRARQILGTPINRSDYLRNPEKTNDTMPIVGQSIGGTNGRPAYRICCEIGRGVFGVVYEVELIDNDDQQRRRFAMKIEIEDCSIRLLKLELHIMKDVAKAAPTDVSHLCQMYDCGKTSKFKYIIMTLLGANLTDVERSQPGQRFSQKSALKISRQCLLAIRQVHRLGYVHRDIKPANFSLGRGNECDKVYLVDFGHCRKFLDHDGERLRAQRAEGSCPLRGTGVYMALNAHYNNEITRGDDVESWFYVTLGMLLNHLPWKTTTNLAEICAAKEPLLPNRSSRHAIATSQQPKRQQQPQVEVPVQFQAILTHIDSLDYWTAPDYAFIERHLLEAMRNAGVASPDEPLLD